MITLPFTFFFARTPIKIKPKSVSTTGATAFQAANPDSAPAIAPWKSNKADTVY